MTAARSAICCDWIARSWLPAWAACSAPVADWLDAVDAPFKHGVRFPHSAHFAPIEQLQMMRFEGENWKLFGDVIEGEVAAPSGG